MGFVRYTSALVASGFLSLPGMALAEGAAISGELSYRTDGEDANSVSLSLSSDYAFPSGFGFQYGGGLRVLDTDSDYETWADEPRGWFGEFHLFREFVRGLKVGAYYVREGGEEGSSDYSYYGGQTMLSYSIFDLEARLGRVSGDNLAQDADTFDIVGYAGQGAWLELAGGYSRVEEPQGPFRKQYFVRAVIDGISRDNGIDFFGQASQIETDGQESELFYEAGIQWDLGRGSRQRAFSSPVSLFSF